MWILQRASYRGGFVTCPAIRARLYKENWAAFEQADALIGEAVSLCDDWATHSPDEISVELLKSAEAYAGIRESTDLWKLCMGKQALGRLAPAIGLANQDALVGHTVRLWAESANLVPDAVQHLREYVEALGP